MPYGAIKVDNITFTNGGADQATTVSGIYRAITSGVTVTGTISGVTIQGTTVSGTTVTGTTATFTSGVIASGTAAAPSLSILGDPNTGVFSPGADQVAISTNGTGRLFVDASGNINLGQASSALQSGGTGLTIYGSTYSEIKFLNSTTGATLTDGTALVTDSLNFSINNREAGSIIFGTSNTEKMRLDSSGRLGLGTSSPSNTAGFSQQLELAGNLPCVSISNTGTGANKYSLGVNGVGAFGVWDNTASAFRMYINSSGSVGIGTTSPAALLDVSAGIKVNSAGFITSGFSNGVNLGGYDAIGYDTNDLVLGGYRTSQFTGLRFYTTGAERARIDSSGRVGIGTNSPSSLLHLVSSGQPKITVADDSGRTLQIHAPDGSSNPGFVGTTTNHDFLLQAGTGAAGLNVMRFNTAGAERVRITDIGRLGIGTTSPGEKLDISSGTSGTAAVVKIQDPAGRVVQIASPSSSTEAYIGTTTSHQLDFYINNAPKATLDTSGRLLVGTSTARTNFYNSSNSARFQIEGSGINDNYALSIVSNYVGSTNGAQVILAKSGGSNVGDNTLVSNGNTIGQISFQGADGTEFVPAASIASEVDGTPGANDMPGCLVFSTTADGASSPTERMRIKNNGSVQIGSTAQLATEMFRVTSSNTWGAAIEVNGNVSGDRALYLSMGTNTNNTSSYFIDCSTATVGAKFYVYGNGTYGTVSDINLKKNIETTRDGYLEDIQQLRVVKYNWKTDKDDAPKELGWIAQELAEVFPGLVQDSQPNADGNTVKEVKTSVLQFILLKALQEAASKIETLEARLTAAGIE